MVWSPGQRVGPWTLEACLHVGPASEVWAAQGPLGPVALKRLSRELLDDEGQRARLMDEARLGSLLSHPNLAKLELWDLAAPVPWLAFERLDGVTLTRLLAQARAQQKALPLPVALWVGRQVANGLSAAHRAVDEAGQLLNVVHRDVCTDNLFVTADGSVHVLDFGIALADQRAARTITGQRLRGRLATAAPEQIRGEPVDARADQYALGAVLFELVTGAPLAPPPADQLWHDGPAPRADTKARVPADVTEVIARLLARRPDERFDSMEEVVQVLEVLSPGDQQPTVAALVRALFPELRRPPRLALVAAVGVGLLLAAFVAWQFFRPVPPPALPPIPADLATDAPTTPVEPAITPAPPAPTPTPTTPEVRPVVAKGRFLLVTRPASTVSVGGRVLGETPLEVELPVGRHRLRLVDEATQQVRWLPVDVRAGQGPRLDVELQGLTAE